ncbi:uncharacterized protein [Anabrus simplex]|uniref:uncharacterized protein isoform X2 n=1 Tax=Anabrus simplex TaxID=316456 RepID=UPI0035A38EF1
MRATSGVLWCLISLLTVGVSSQSLEQQEDLVPLQCILLENMPEGCTNVTVADSIPERLKELYFGISDETKKQFKHGNLAQLSESQLLEIPLQLIYLIPTLHMQTIPGEILASLVKKHSGDPVVTTKCIESVSIAERESFLKNLQDTNLSEDVQQILAETLVIWYPNPDIHWKFDLLFLVKKIGNPLLAYLPPHFLFNLSKDTATKFLFHMREWKDFSGNQNFPLQDKPWAVKRVWSYLAISHDYPSKLQDWKQEDLERYGFLLSGAMPDELKLVRREEGSFQMFTNLKLGKLQVRSLLQSFFTNSSLGPVSFEKVRPVLHHMAPRDFLRFLNDSIDFSTILSSASGHSVSLPTAKQILELSIAQLVINGKLASTNASTWGESIHNLGKLVYALPNSALKLYNKSLPMTVLTAIDSENLSMTQARYLAARSNISDILQSKGLLNGLKASNLSSLNVKNLPQPVLNHVLSNLPDGSLARSFVVLQKVRKDLNAGRIRAMLLNKNPNQFFGLLSSLEFSANVKQMKALFQTLKEEPLKQSARRLSPLMLSTFLSKTRENMAKDNLKWTLESITSSSSGLHIANVGITCNDVATMETADLVSIFATFNRERKLLHKDFPKELQYCSQKALMDLLVMKRDLRQTNKTGSLQSFLEPSEITAFGGYILASLSKTTVQSSDISAVIRAIGSLSIPEILLASSSSNPNIYTKMYVDNLLSSNERLLKIDANELFTLGNLVFFLDVPSINSIKSASFKFFIEFVKPRDKILCAGTQARNAWNRLIVSAFGNPNTWTFGTVATLGDLLLVLNEDQLEQIPADSWILASDVLTEHTSYHTSVDWPGEATKIPFVQVCLKFLDGADHSAYTQSVHKLVRRYLVGAQKLLNTVLPASELLNVMPKPASKPELRTVSVQLGQPIPEIEIIPVSKLGQPIPDIEIIPEFAEDESTSEDLKENFTIVTGEMLRVMVKRQTLNHMEMPRILSIESEVLSQQVTKVSCDAIKTAGQSASIALEGGDIARMSPEDLNDCVETLGSLELAADVKETFWMLVVKENISVELETAGHLLSSIPAEVVSKLNFTFPSSLEIFAGLGAEVTNKTVLQLTARKFLANNEEPTRWNAETIAAMGHMICKLEKSYLDRSLGQDDIFVETSVVMGKTLLDGCPRICLEDLARIAQKRTSYGNPERWTAEDLMSLGVIAAGLKREDLTLLNSTASNNPFVGLQPSAVKCMQPSSFQALTAEQISSLSPMAAEMVDSEKKEMLSVDQMTALRTVLLQSPKKELREGLQTSEDKDGAAAATETNFFLLLCMTTLIAYLFSSGVRL